MGVGVVKVRHQTLPLCAATTPQKLYGSSVASPLFSCYQTVGVYPVHALARDLMPAKLRLPQIANPGRDARSSAKTNGTNYLNGRPRPTVPHNTPHGSRRRRLARRAAKLTRCHVPSEPSSREAPAPKTRSGTPPAWTAERTFSGACCTTTRRSAMAQARTQSRS